MELIVNIIKLLWFAFTYLSWTIFYTLKRIIIALFSKKNKHAESMRKEIDELLARQKKASRKPDKLKTNSVNDFSPQDNTKVLNKPKKNIKQNTYNKTRLEEPTTEELRELFPDIYGDTYKYTSTNIMSFLNDKGIYKFYHFTDVRNLESIISNGGLYSWYGLEQKHINSFNSSNQLSRNLDVHQGLKDYVRLSYTSYHPMSTKVSYQDNKKLIWLDIDIKVATIESTLFSNMNATDSNMQRSNDLNFIRNLNFSVFGKRYNHLTSLEKKQYQAEILVKSFIPLKYILNLETLKKRYL